MIIAGHLSACEMPEEQGREQLTFPDTARSILDKLYNPRHVPATGNLAYTMRSADSGNYWLAAAYTIPDQGHNPDGWQCLELVLEG